MIELRKENSLFLQCTTTPGELIAFYENQGLAITTTNGLVCSENHYGFCFKDGNGNTNFYSTQCPLFGVEIENGILKVYEEGKSISWQIDVKTGEVKECAKFLNISRRDLNYLYERFGLEIDDLDKVNSYLEDSKELKKLQ